MSAPDPTATRADWNLCRVKFHQNCFYASQSVCEAVNYVVTLFAAKHLQSL
jgi:hypothetical protein